MKTAMAELLVMPGILQLVMEKNDNTCYCRNILSNITGAKMKNKAIQIIRKNVALILSIFIMILGFIVYPFKV